MTAFRIHKEGKKIIRNFSVLLLAADALVFVFAGMVSGLALLVVFGLFMFFVSLFFRKPDRRGYRYSNSLLYAPADGKIVAIEEIHEKEHFGKTMLQVSVFMSIWDVHINWFPVTGKVLRCNYHPGKYLVARHPKSSLLNERTTIVLETPKGRQILMRQIAGAVARRIICYAREDKVFQQGTELGFIRFGSRVDLVMPPGTKVLAEYGQQVYGMKTPLAKLE